MTIAMTGMNGYLGSILAARWRDRGHQVRGITARLGDPVAPEEMADADILVHCAYDRRRGMEDVNTQGARLLLAAARGVRRKLLVSSHSARADTRSRYGLTKYNIEHLFGDECIVRPGLVLGPGGLCSRNFGRLERTTLAPLVNAATSELALIGEQDFVAAVTRIVENGCRGQWNLFYAQSMTLAAFTHLVWESLGRRGKIVNVPEWLARAFSAIPGSELADSVRAQFANRTRLHRSNLAELVPDHSAPEAAIRTAVRNYLARAI